MPVPRHDIARAQPRRTNAQPRPRAGRSEPRATGRRRQIAVISANPSNFSRYIYKLHFEFLN